MAGGSEIRKGNQSAHLGMEDHDVFVVPFLESPEFSEAALP
jgi:hypothetical protein